MGWNNTTIRVTLTNGETVGLSIYAISLGINHERARKRWWHIGKPDVLGQEQCDYIFAKSRNGGSKAIYTITVELEDGETVALTLAKMPKYFAAHYGLHKQPWFYRQRWEKAHKPMYAQVGLFIDDQDDHDGRDSGTDEWHSLGTRITPEKVARLASIPAPTPYEARL
jgi:hypothetical protein